MAISLVSERAIKYGMSYLQAIRSINVQFVGLLFVMCVLLLSMKIIAMTKLIIEWENVRILALIKKPEVENDGEEMGDNGRQEVVKNTVRTKVTDNFSEKTKETGKQTNISIFLQQTIPGMVILDLSEN